MSWRYNQATGEWWDDEDIYHQTVVDQWNADTGTFDKVPVVLPGEQEPFEAPRRWVAAQDIGTVGGTLPDATIEETQEALEFHQPVGRAEKLRALQDQIDREERIAELREASQVNWPRGEHVGYYEPVEPVDLTEVKQRMLGTPANARGIDVARYQGAPDWAKVRADGIEFAYIKANEGTGTSYPTTADQVMGAQRAGLKVGLYHYAKPNLSPLDSADAFAQQVHKFGATSFQLPPCLDLEEGAGNLSGWAKQFLARLRARTGLKRVMLYSGASFFSDQIREDWMDPDIALWIAHYGPEPGKPRYLTPRVAIHQFSSTGRVDGIAGNVDLNHAIWPLDKIIAGESGAEDDVSPELERMIRDIHATLTRPIKAWPGGSTGYPGVEAYTPLQYMLRDNVEQLQTRYGMSALTRQVAELTTTVAALLQRIQVVEQPPPMHVQPPDIRRGETVTRVDPSGYGYPDASGDYPR